MENIDIMNDNELDLFARKAFITSMESSSYVSPVSLMYGIGLETAYDDGFFSRLMRGLGRATAFTNASKVKAALKDIRHLSVDKISDGETSGVSVDRKLLADAANIIRKYFENVKKNEKLIKEFISEYATVVGNKEFKAKLDYFNNLTQDKGTKAGIQFLKFIMGSVIGGGLAGFAANTSANALNAALSESMAAIFGTPVIAAPSAFTMTLAKISGLVSWIFAIYSLVMFIKVIITLCSSPSIAGDRLKDDLLSKFVPLNNKASEIFRGITGLPLSGDITSKLESLSSKYEEVLNFEPNKTKTVSKEDKVQIVQGLIALSDNEGDVIKSLSDAKLKEAIKVFSKVKDVLNSLDNDTSVLKEVENAIKASAFMYKLNDSSLKIILATLNDAKKY